MQKVVTSFNLNISLLKLFFYSQILINNNLLLKSYCENIVVVFLNCHFLILNTTRLNPKQKTLRDKDHHTFFIPNLLLNLTFTSHLSHIQYSHQIKEKRERRIWSRWRSRCTDRRPMEIEVAERTKPVEIGVHHAAQPHPPPHRHSSSSLPPDWIRLAYSFFFFSFFHICLFWFNIIVRIGFCFVFCVWIMWDIFWEWSKETETKTKCSLGQIRCFLISFYFYSNSLLWIFFFQPKIVNIPVWCRWRL